MVMPPIDAAATNALIVVTNSTMTLFPFSEKSEKELREPLLLAV